MVGHPGSWLRDQVLVQRLRWGDEGACRELVTRFHSGVYGYLRYLGADPHAAEDLTQETYARAWQAIGDLRLTSSLRAWLLTIARNEYLQAWRRRRAPVDTRETPPDPPDPTPARLDLMIEEERDAALRGAVAGLEPPFGEAIALHYFHGLSLRQVAEIQGVPVGTAKSRVHEALARLRARLQEKEQGHVRPGA
jgi:RNA polymerase sigma factor (sigma-70 family)